MNEIKWKTPQRTNPVHTVLAAAAIFSRMRAWGRGALPINKMDWLSWVSQLGYTQLCVVLGTVSLRGKKDGEGELQLWYRAMFNDCGILYASRDSGEWWDDMWVIDVFPLSLPRLHWQNQQNQNVINREVEISFRPILKTNSTMWEYW